MQVSWPALSPAQEPPQPWLASPVLSAPRGPIFIPSPICTSSPHLHPQPLSAPPVLSVPPRPCLHPSPVCTPSPSVAQPPSAPPAPVCTPSPPLYPQSLFVPSALVCSPGPHLHPRLGPAGTGLPGLRDCCGVAQMLLVGPLVLPGPVSNKPFSLPFICKDWVPAGPGQPPRNTAPWPAPTGCSDPKLASRM